MDKNIKFLCFPDFYTKIKIELTHNILPLIGKFLYEDTICICKKGMRLDIKFNKVKSKKFSAKNFKGLLVFDADQEPGNSLSPFRIDLVDLKTKRRASLDEPFELEEKRKILEAIYATKMKKSYLSEAEQELLVKEGANSDISQLGLKFIWNSFILRKNKEVKLDEEFMNDLEQKKSLTKLIEKMEQLFYFDKKEKSKNLNLKFFTEKDFNILTFDVFFFYLASFRNFKINGYSSSHFKGAG